MDYTINGERFCYNENALGFYEKLGMTNPNDVVVLNRAAWTDFTVE